MDQYKLSKDSPIQRVTVDGKKLKGGGDWVSLTAAQVSRAEDTGAKLDTKPSSGS